MAEVSCVFDSCFAHAVQPDDERKLFATTFDPRNEEPIVDQFLVVSATGVAERHSAE